MAKQHTKDGQQGAPAPMETWYSRAQAAAFLGVTVKQLTDWGVQHKGPWFRKHGTTPQSPVAYPESSLIKYRDSLPIVETDTYETQKAS